ncbi:MAG: hypothetical protein KAR00_02595 [Candidatus Pacebacteria bacterium]|nr:hypothetical protein [Candidatus Paceibacterota bacterium]
MLMLLKKFLFFSIFVSLLGGTLFPALVSAENEVNIYFFYGENCPHCEKEEIFLETLKENYPRITVHDYEVYYNEENIDLLKQAARILQTNVNGVPFTVIGDMVFAGFSETITSTAIEKRVQECLASICPDSLAKLLVTEPESPEIPIIEPPAGTSEIEIPLLGSVNPLSFSLPLLSIILGILDGFNPCAMWTLLFLISLLLGMKNRKRMWILGTTFIVTSAAVYFLFMAAWLNLILFIGFIIWVRLLIGLIALLGGGLNLKSYFTEKNAVCEVTKGNKQQKIFEKLKNITQEHNFLFALAGIIVLAFAVNLVELVCSAGFPAVYTQVLALNNLPIWQYYAYILLYVTFFMTDDLFIFIAAMITLKMTGVTTKYTRLSKLIGGTLMVAIGLTLIFRPEWLMFG